MRAPAWGPPAAGRSRMNRLARGSASKFFVWAASRDSSSRGAPSADSAYGVTDPYGKPARWTERVDRTPRDAAASSTRAARTAVSLADAAVIAIECTIAIPCALVEYARCERHDPSDAAGGVRARCRHRHRGSRREAGRRPRLAGRQYAETRIRRARPTSPPAGAVVRARG